MCANGVNTEQYKQMIDYMDDTLAVNRRWIHKMAHTVEDNGYAKTSMRDIAAGAGIGVSNIYNYFKSKD